MVKAQALCPGDRVGIVAPAGPVVPEQLDRGVAWLRRQGYEVALAPHIQAVHGYLAGSDRDRAADFMDMWLRPDIAGIICARGGYGCMRILPYLDWHLLRERPKFFCGYSDVTALHLALARACGLVTFHGEMVGLSDSLSPYNAYSLLRAMQTAAPLGRLPARPAAEFSPLCPGPHVTLVGGRACGPLVGGNLTLISMLEGTPWAIETAGRIVLLEDVDEEPRCVDRMLVHLLLAGKLQDAAAIIFAFSPTCEQAREEENEPPRPSLNLLQVLEELLVPLRVPLVYGLPLGHGANRLTVPLGVMAELDADAGELRVLEAALTA